jgi:phenylalanyl-tRNA synthetase beta chain
VRYAKEGETIVALDGKKYDLHTNNLLIADDVKPIAIAGVMGGEYSGINPDTTTVFLEAAKFAKDTVRSSSRELGLRSDSSSRYEKGVDFYSIEAGRERALALFDELGVGKVTSLSVSAGKEVPKERILITTTTKICDLIGIKISAETMVKILNNLGIKTTLDGINLSCVIPLYREDIDNYTDLAEEVIRYYGYDNIKSTFIKNAHPTVGGISTRAKNVEKVKDVLVSYGAYEALTYSFISQKAYDTLRFASDDPIRNTIRILNPLSEEFTVMRTQLVSSMLDSVYTNFSRKNDDFRLFEIGKVYIPKSLPLTELPQEIETLCFALVGKNEDFYAAKEIATEVFKTLGVTCDFKRSAAPYLHPGISADFINEGKVVGSVGKLHPLVAEKYKIDQNVIIATITLEDFVNCDEKAVKYAPLPKFPIVERDLAVTVNVDVPVGNMIKVIKQNMGSYCAGIVLFDVYTGEQVEAGKKSVAFSIKINPGEKTLIDAQIQDIMNGILAALNEEFDAKIRA